LECRRPFPVFDTIDFDRVHGDAIFANDNTKIFNFSSFELAFLGFKVKVIVSQDLEDIIDNSPM
jgi:hypothetical protein